MQDFQLYLDETTCTSRRLHQSKDDANLHHHDLFNDNRVLDLIQRAKAHDRTPRTINHEIEPGVLVNQIRVPLARGPAIVMNVTTAVPMRKADTIVARDVRAHGIILQTITTTRATSMTGMAITRTHVTLIFKMTEVLINVRVRRRIGAIIVDMVLTHHRRAHRTPSNTL